MTSKSKYQTGKKPKFLPRIVLKFQDHLRMPYRGQKEIDDYFKEHHHVLWDLLFKTYSGIRITKLFSTVTPEQILELVENAKARNKSYTPPNFLNYFALDFRNEKEKENILHELWKDKDIQYAYKECGPVEPPAGGPVSGGAQGFLEPAPLGINTAILAGKTGKDGINSVQFIDIEQGWDLDHEGFPIIGNGVPKIKVLAGENLDHFGHGTAVLGIVLAQANTAGCIGITPYVTGNVISQAQPVLGDGTVLTETGQNTEFVNNISNAIITATQSLNAGDVLLIEAQIVFDANNAGDPKEYPVEIEQAIFEAIELATQKGIIVVEPAGNGSRNLDSFKDDFSKKVLKRTVADPLTGTEAPNPGFKDSGAIMVGSARATSRHSREGSSNFGSRVDCYAWGEKIKTIGNGARTIRNTTDSTLEFGGTSGASAIIAGMILSIQSIREKAGQLRYSPKEMRKILSDPLNGTTSSRISNKIGVMPDFQKLINNGVI